MEPWLLVSLGEIFQHREKNTAARLQVLSKMSPAARLQVLSKMSPVILFTILVIKVSGSSKLSYNFKSEQQL